MASIEHPCCVRIVAVCMTQQMMLITQLMPLGSLLDYVRNNKDMIGSKVMLNWCAQIAKVCISRMLFIASPQTTSSTASPSSFYIYACTLFL